MLPEQPWGVVASTQLPARFESPEEKQTPVQLVLTSQSRDPRQHSLSISTVPSWIACARNCRVTVKQQGLTLWCLHGGGLPGLGQWVLAAQGEGKGRQYQSGGLTSGRELEPDPRKSTTRTKHEWAESERQSQRAWSPGLEEGKQKGGREGTSRH